MSNATTQISSHDELAREFSRVLANSEDVDKALEIASDTLNDVPVEEMSDSLNRQVVRAIRIMYVEIKQLEAFHARAMKAAE